MSKTNKRSIRQFRQNDDQQNADMGCREIEEQHAPAIAKGQVVLMWLTRDDRLKSPTSKHVIARTTLAVSESSGRRPVDLLFRRLLTAEESIKSSRRH